MGKKKEVEACDELGDRNTENKSLTNNQQKENKSENTVQGKQNEEADTEETLKPERFGLDGKNGVGGVWHIDFLTVPDGPKKINNWTIQRYYENELKTCPVMTPDESGPGIEIKLPIPEGVADKKSLEVGIWNKLTRKWETEDISINEQKDGSIFFCTKQTGAFRFFIGK